MKNIFILFVLSVFFFVSCGSKPDKDKVASMLDSLKELPSGQIVAASDTDQFGFRTGVIVYSSETMGISQSITMWFDDFGRKTMSEIESSMLGQTIHQLNIVKDSLIYNIDMVSKTGNWSKAGIDTTDETYNYRKLTAEDMKLHNIAEEGKEVIIGKECTIYSMSEIVTGQQVDMKVWIWEGIPMKSVSSVSGIQVTMEAVEMKVNIDIPAGKFDIPEGVKMEELKQTHSDSLPS